MQTKVIQRRVARKLPHEKSPTRSPPDDRRDTAKCEANNAKKTTGALVISYPHTHAHRTAYQGCHLHACIDAPYPRIQTSSSLMPKGDSLFVSAVSLFRSWHMRFSQAQA